MRQVTTAKVSCFGKSITLSGYVDDHYHQHLAEAVMPELGLLTMTTLLLKPGQTVVDVGANIGFYSLAALSIMNNDGAAYAFEPSKASYELLEKNVADNGLTESIRCFNYGLGSEAGKHHLLYNATELSGAFVSDEQDMANDHDTSESISIKVLDKVRPFAACDLLKVDVEGYDLLLRGSPDMPIGLYHLHLATTEQLTRLYYKPGMLKTVSKRLKVLVDNGYIQADCIPTKLFKSPYYYTLDTKGMRYLSDIGLDTDNSFRASKEVSESYLHLRHALELNDVLIAALRLKYAYPQYYLSRFIHERTLKRTPYKAGNVTLIPDGFLDIRDRSRNLSLSLLIEHDRGTEQQEHFRRRIKAYSAFLSSGAYKQLLGTERVTVAFTTFISAKRVAQMREWTKAELDPQLAGLFIFAELPKPLEPRNLLFEKRWYTLLNDQPIALLEG